MPFSPPALDTIEDESDSKPFRPPSVSTLEPDISDISPLNRQGVNLSSEFASGHAAQPPSDINAEDWGFTRATRGGLPGILSDTAGAIQSKVIEPIAARAINSAINPLRTTPDMVKPGKSIIPDAWLPLADKKGFIPALTRTLKGFTTPGNIVTLPIAVGSKAVQKVFLTAIAASAPDSIQELARAQTPDEIKDAATSLGINAVFAAALSRGIKDGSLAPKAPTAAPGGVKTPPPPQRPATATAIEPETPPASVPTTPEPTVKPISQPEVEATENVPVAAPSSETAPAQSEIQQIAQLPVADLMSKVSKSKGGLTGDAWRIGQEAKSPEDVAILKSEMEKSAADFKQARATMKQARTPEETNTAIANATAIANRGQYFREAYEAATGTGSAGFALSKDPNYKPPFPVNPEPTERVVQKENVAGRETPATAAGEVETPGSRPATQAREPHLFKDMSDDDLYGLLQDFRGRYKLGAKVPNSITLIRGELAHRAGQPPGTLWGNFGFLDEPAEPVPQAKPAAPAQAGVDELKPSTKQMFEDELAKGTPSPIDKQSQGKFKPNSPSLKNAPQGERSEPGEYNPRPAEIAITQTDNGISHFSEPKFQRGWKRHRFVFSVDGKGVAMLDVMEYPEQKQGDPYPHTSARLAAANIHSAYTIPEFQRKGIMQKLVLAADKYLPFPLKPDYLNTGEMRGMMKKMVGEKSPSPVAPAAKEPAVQPQGQGGVNPATSKFQSTGKLTANDLQVGEKFQTSGDKRVAPVGGTISKVNPKTVVVQTEYMGKPMTLTLRKDGLTGEIRIKRGDKYYSSAHQESPQPLSPPADTPATGKPLSDFEASQLGRLKMKREQGRAMSDAEKASLAKLEAKQPAEQPKPGEIGQGPGIVGMGGDVPHPREAATVGAGQDIYGIAARVRKARADAGQVAPVPTGEGVSPEEAVKWGQDLIAMGADPEVSMREFERTRATSFDLIAFTRAYGEQLANAARRIEEKFGTDSKEYRMAQKALSDWDTRTKPIQTEWHKQGMAQQGETDIDTGSFTGIARAVREVTGTELTPPEVKAAKKIAAGVKQAEAAVEQAKPKLETAIDNLTDTGKPRYSDYVLKVADGIVKKWEGRANAARIRLKDKWNAQFKMGIKPGDPLPLSMVKDLVEIGVYHAAKTTAEFLKWSDLMVREFGENVRPYLKQIHDQSLKVLDAEGDKHGKNAEDVKKAVKKSGGTKAPTDLKEQQKVFQDYESGKPMTPVQVKTLWTRAKTEYIDKGETNFGDTVHNLADDLGIDAKDVLKGLSQTKQVKRIADDVWQKQRQARMLKAAAKRWIEHSQETWLQKTLPTVAKTMFSMKVGLHGTVAMGTHAPLVVATHPIVFANNFGKMYKLVASPEFYQMQQSAMTRRPNYSVAQRNGLVNDMSKMEDFNDPQLAQGFPKMAAWFKEKLDRVHLGRFQGMGTRGYSVLKILRQDLFDKEWDKLPESMKTDSMAKAIADSVNHITGVTKAGAGKLGRAASYALFAPKLEASRVAVMVADPLKAANSLLKMDNMTESERWFAKNQFKEKAKIFAVFTGLLLANQQLNNLFGDKKKLNGVPEFLGGGGWNPMESDFMKFRVAGMNMAWGSPFLTMARLPLRIYQIGAGDGGKTKYLIYPDESMYKTAGSYLRTQASPFLSPVISVITKGDFQDRPLPKIPGYGEPPPMPKRLAAQGVKPYTWAEFGSGILLPIPFEEGFKEIMHNQGLARNEKEKNELLKSFATIIFMGATGGRLSEDWTPQKKAPTPTQLYVPNAGR